YPPVPHSFPTRRSSDLLDRTALVHGGRRLGYGIEGGLEIEEQSGMDPLVEDVVEQFRNVATDGGGPAPQSDIAAKHGIDWDLDMVGHPDETYYRAGSGDSER